MRRSSLIGTFAILSATIGSPVLAQEMGGATGPGPQADYQGYTYDQGGYYDQGYQPPYNDQGYRRSYDRRRPYRGNGPVGTAAGVVGGAAETAGAVATAPFRAFDNRDSYAMAQGDSYCAQRYRSYDPASGTFMGYDGQRHPCP
jgi:BA14K-like protein